MESFRNFEESVILMSIVDEKADLKEEIQRHYDDLSPWYRLLWGQHIHHGLWTGNEDKEKAQENLVIRLAEFAGIRPGSSVLDIGCGLGASAIWLADKLDCKILGITISPVQAHLARQSTRKHPKAEQVRFEVMDANDLSLPENSFDAIWTVECSEHLVDKAGFFARCSEILRPNGVIGCCAWLLGDVESEERSDLVDRVCEGMLCPSLGTASDYEEWLQAAEFHSIQTQILTRQVEKTWNLCVELLNHPISRMLMRLKNPKVREFTDAFRAIQQAYASGAMQYGMFAARRG